MILLIKFHMPTHGLLHAAAVGQAGGPFVIEFVVCGDVEAGGDAGAGEHLLVVATGEYGNAGHFAKVAVLFHEHGGVHEFEAHGEGEVIIDLEGKVGIQ